MAAITTVTSERGYASTRVVDVLRRTGISSRTFYVYFKNRQGCFFAAYDQIVADLSLLLAGMDGSEPSGDAELVLGRVLEHFGAWPAHARVLLVEVLSAGPDGEQRHERTMAMLAGQLAACERWQPGRCDSLDRHEVAQAVIGAMVRMVQLRLSAHLADTLPQLRPSLTALTTRVTLAPSPRAARA